MPGPPDWTGTPRPEFRTWTLAGSDCAHLAHTREIDWAKIEGFDWDEGDIRKSRDKHDVGQTEAEQVFLNEPLFVLEDHPHSRSAPRWHALGQSDTGRRLHVTFTLRGGGTLLRVISARDQSRRERRIHAAAQ